MRAIARQFVMSALVLLGLMSTSLFGQDITEPEGYRDDNYRAPTPATLNGARAVNTA